MTQPKPRRPPQPRTVRSVHLPTAVDRKIARAAKRVNRSVVGYIRDAAEAQADKDLKAA